MTKLSRLQKAGVAMIMALAIAAPIAIAQSGGGAGKEGRGQWRGGHGGGDRMMGFGKLDLTDAQKTQIQQIRQAHRDSLSPLMSDIRAKRQEIHQASQSGTFSESVVAQKLAEIAPLEAKVMGEQFRIHQEMLAVLTPEQKAKLEQARAEQRSKRGERGPRKGR